jgi:TetR/AcrR family tetracycline transcriptional repressor
VAADRLSKAAVAERALRLGDEEGLEAVTIRRLAQELGVTPMALYWHFKNKDELLLGIVDHALRDVRADHDATATWQVQVRSMFEALVRIMVEHPVLEDLVHNADKASSQSFNRATEDALALLSQGGFTLEESHWVASYLLHGAMGAVAAWPDCPRVVPPDQAAEWRRQRRLKIERLPAEQFPMMIAYATTLNEAPDTDRYLRFTIDLLMAGVEAAARGRAPAL